VRATSLRNKGHGGSEGRSTDWNVTRAGKVSMIAVEMVDKYKLEGNKEGG